MFKGSMGNRFRGRNAQGMQNRAQMAANVANAMQNRAAEQPATAPPAGLIEALRASGGQMQGQLPGPQPTVRPPASNFGTMPGPVMPSVSATPVMARPEVPGRQGAMAKGGFVCRGDGCARKGKTVGKMR